MRVRASKRAHAISFALAHPFSFIYTHMKSYAFCVNSQHDSCYTLVRCTSQKSFTPLYLMLRIVFCVWLIYARQIFHSPSLAANCNVSRNVLHAHQPFFSAFNINFSIKFLNAFWWSWCTITFHPNECHSLCVSLPLSFSLSPSPYAHACGRVCPCVVTVKELFLQSELFMGQQSIYSHSYLQEVICRNVYFIKILLIDL